MDGVITESQLSSSSPDKRKKTSEQHRLASVSGAWHKRRGRADAMPDFAIERGCAGLVCGVDEAGRGPLAGPVVSRRGDPRPAPLPRHPAPRPSTDSKVLSREARETCYGAAPRLRQNRRGQDWRRRCQHR